MYRWHIRIGLLFTSVFMATGLYMVWIFSGGEQYEPGQRMMYRATHVYILLSSLVNLTLGTFGRWREERPLRIQQVIGSILVLAAPAIFTVAFFLEPPSASLMRGTALTGVFSVFIGVLLQWNAFTQKRRLGGDDPSSSAHDCPSSSAHDCPSSSAHDCPSSSAHD